MNVSTAADLLAPLQSYSLLTGEQMAVVRGDLARRYRDSKALAHELIQRNWLTPFQANRLLQGRGAELVLGGYVLLDRLGEGGMGIVYKARHRLLDRLVALKCIQQARLGTGPEVVARFRREAKVTARLAHPNIVTIHDADEDRGRLFYVMEYVEGKTLAQLVKEHGPLPVGEACEYIRQAALGLQHAHEAGLVHRDVKPANLIVVRGDVVKVLDLGLARCDSEGEDRTAGGLTQTGIVMGTPDYIAPEQCRDAHSADIRSDVYSLGCTLYHLLAGHPPFPTGSTAQKLAWHMVAEPGAIQQARPDLPAELAALVHRMMAKQPADRIQTPGEVAGKLASLVVTLPTIAPVQGGSQPTLPVAQCPTIDTTPRRQPQRLARSRWRAIVRAGALMLLLALPIALVAWIGWPRNQPGVSPSDGTTDGRIGEKKPPDSTPPSSGLNGTIAVASSSSSSSSSTSTVHWPEDLMRPPGTTQSLRAGPLFNGSNVQGATIITVLGQVSGGELTINRITLTQRGEPRRIFKGLEEMPRPQRDIAQTLCELGRRGINGNWLSASGTPLICP